MPIHMQMQKQMVGKQTFVWPSLSMGHKEDFDPRGLAGFLPSVSPSSC